MEKKKTPTKRKQIIKEENENSSKKTNKISKEKSKKQEKKKEIKIKKLTKKQLIIICSIITICILGAALCTFIAFNNKETKIETCSVQFNTNGGIELDQINIDCGGTIEEPETPYKEGFDFIGWYLYGKEYVFLSKVDKNLVLEAKWKVQEGIKLVTVSFDTGGGSKQDDIELKRGTYLTKPVDPTKKGYTFVGWYLDGEEFSFVSNPIDKNIKLKAKWKKEEKIKNENTTSIKEDTQNNNDKNEKEIYHKYDKVLEEYSGKWYLTGYEDVFLEVSKHQYSDVTVMQIITTNFSLPFEGSSSSPIAPPYLKYPHFTKNENNEFYSISSQSAEIRYNNWEKDLSKTKLKLNSTSIVINGNVFVRNKGTKNKYTGKLFNKAVGTWYLYNRPNSQIKIYVEGEDGDPSHSKYYCILYEQFHLDKFKSEGDTSEVYTYGGGVGCEKAVDDSLFLKYNISVKNDELTITSGKQTKKFYKTKKTIEVSNINMSESSVDMYIGNTKQLTTKIEPSDAYNKEIVWSSDNNLVATVNQNGLVTGKSKGQATITAKTTNGNKIAKCIVTVKPVNVSGIKLNKENITLVINKEETLSVQITPTNATNQKVTMTSSDTNVATIDSNATIKAKYPGTAIITVTTEDGGHSASCKVTVVFPKLVASGSLGVKTIVSSGSM